VCFDTDDCQNGWSVGFQLFVTPKQTIAGCRMMRHFAEFFSRNLKLLRYSECSI